MENGNQAIPIQLGYVHRTNNHSFPPTHDRFLPTFVNAHMQEVVALYDSVLSLFTHARVLHMRRTMQHASPPSSTFSNPRNWKKKETHTRAYLRFVSFLCLFLRSFTCIAAAISGGSKGRHLRLHQMHRFSHGLCSSL